MDIIKVFISQPMGGRSDEDIIAERDKLMHYVSQIYRDWEVIELNSYYHTDIKSKNEPLKMLGMSIELLADADVAIFADGWSLARGCKIEHTCAKEYGVPIIDLDD